MFVALDGSFGLVVLTKSTTNVVSAPASAPAWIILGTDGTVLASGTAAALPTPRTGHYLIASTLSSPTFEAGKAYTLIWTYSISSNSLGDRQTLNVV